MTIRINSVRQRDPNEQVLATWGADDHRLYAEWLDINYKGAGDFIAGFLWSVNLEKIDIVLEYGIIPTEVETFLADRAETRAQGD